MNIAELVDRHVPLRDERGSWEDVLHRADISTQRRWRRRSVALALAAAVAVALGSALAVAASQDWWFLQSEGTPQPISGVDVVRTGNWNGQEWALTAYRTAYREGKVDLCWGIGGSSAGEGAAQACANVPGELRITFLSSSFTATRYVSGPVVAAAQTVRITLADGKVVETPTFAAPSDLGPIRFYATPLPSDAAVSSLAGLDAQGQDVARLNP